MREPPPEIAARLRASSQADRFIILRATADDEELHLTLVSLDVVLHTSSMGESFGYGIAEPMNLGKPVVTHSVPWGDQAQIELVRHGECGFVASTPAGMARAMVELAGDAAKRERMGRTAAQHVRTVANAETSVGRLERALQTAVDRRDNALAREDLEQAGATAAYLDAHQFGHTPVEQLRLRLRYLWYRFHQFRKAINKP